MTAPDPETMNVIANDLEPQIEVWMDCGDYPSAAGAGPLPSHKFISCIDGSVTVELTAENLIFAIEQEVWGELETDTRPAIHVTKWAAKNLELIDGKIRLTLEVAEFEADDVVDEPPEREYEPESKYEREPYE